MFRACLRLALIAWIAMLCSAAGLAQTSPKKGWMWIWTKDSPQTAQTLFTRHRFSLPLKPVSARLYITADDLYFAYLNGSPRPVASGKDWTVVQEFNVTQLLRKGDNVLAVEVTSTGGYGGLLYRLLVTLPGGRTMQIVSDRNVRVNRRPAPAWTSPELDDSAWAPASEVARANGGVWGALRGAPTPDPSRITRVWDVKAGGKPDENPYSRERAVGERMILSSSVSSLTDMQMLAGAGFSLFQTDSDPLSTEETEPGQWMWRRQNDARAALQALGLDWAYFTHFAFPPAWQRRDTTFTRLQCLEHHQPVEAFSVWDPTWPLFVDNGYKALGAAYAHVGADGVHRSVLSGLLAGVHGDYGDAGFPTGGRVSVPAQKEDWVRRFGNAHDHLGWWCDDPLAKADFRSTMIAKYGTLDKLNDAWKTEFKSPDSVVYPTSVEHRRYWIDFVDWYTGAAAHALDIILAAARKYFPDTLCMTPAGFGDEDLRGGNDNSLIAKVTAMRHADVRTTLGAFRPFAESSAGVLGRLASASRFYKAPFWAEIPSGLSADQQTDRLFSVLSSGAKGLFDWSANAIANRDIYYKYGKFLRVERPVTDVAMLYPSTAHKLHPEQPYPPLFEDSCARLRGIMNYDIVDERMIQDGCLSRYRVLVMWESGVLEQPALEKIREWVKGGGVLTAYDFGKIQNVEGDSSWFNDMYGYVQHLDPARITERYVGTVPANYRVMVGLPESADYLSGDWSEPSAGDGDVTGRWAGNGAAVRMPVDPRQRYRLIVKATLPNDAVGARHTVEFNGQEIGSLDSPGDWTYKLTVPASAMDASALATLVFRTVAVEGAVEGAAPADAPPGPQAPKLPARAPGIFVTSVRLSAIGADEPTDIRSLPGVIRRELNVSLLRTTWVSKYDKGLTVYFPATRALIKGYEEVIKRVVYHLSDIEADRRDAISVYTEHDGLYTTLCTDKALLYNATDHEMRKHITIPAAAFAAWQGEVVTPARTEWDVVLPAHAIDEINFAPPPQELLLECEKFTEPGALRPAESADCSPGVGLTCMPVPAGLAISTRFPVDLPGNYALYVRAARSGKLEPMDVLVDDQPVMALPARTGQTYWSGNVPLTHGTHKLTLRAHEGRAVKADFVLLTNDPAISGYGFAVRTAPVE